ncbi:hypothetical protein HYW76_05115 [Candidatus Pacearchaeota archaeon]|nr:hypothetical protein [Candidatus Pacearchaeota archaeon]
MTIENFVKKTRICKRMGHVDGGVLYPQNPHLDERGMQAVTTRCHRCGRFYERSLTAEERERYNDWFKTLSQPMTI